MRTPFAFTLAAALTAASGLASADTFVRGYARSDGSYVAPHYRSSPNSTQLDNYSARGNLNPYTGQAGSAPSELYPAPSYRPSAPSYPATPAYPTYTNPYATPRQ